MSPKVYAPKSMSPKGLPTERYELPEGRGVFERVSEIASRHGAEVIENAPTPNLVHGSVTVHGQRASLDAVDAPLRAIGCYKANDNEK